MKEAVDLGEWIRQTLTFGGVGIWTIVLMLAGTLWKGLPGVLTALDNRLSKQQDRIDREFERLERQISEGDERHKECLEGQRLLRKELEEVYGQLRQLRQLIASGVPAATMPGVSPMVAPLLTALGNVPVGDKL